MKLKKFNKLPVFMQNSHVHEIYDSLKSKQISLVFKRLFDVIFSFILLVFFTPLIILVSLAIKIESRGPIFFIQKRVTTNGRIFNILKMRTMINKAEQFGPKITANKDIRITRVGWFLRKYRIDELPQLVNILFGDMTFVGTRPEVPEIVEIYTEKMFATLLLPAGITSLASIKHLNESKNIGSENQVLDYIHKVLDEKMELNLSYLKEFSILKDLIIILKTFIFLINA